MRKQVIRLTVAVLTFTIGVVVAFVFSAPRQHESNQFTAKVEKGFLDVKDERLQQPRGDTRPIGLWDLSVVVEVSEPNPNPPSHSRRYIKLAKNGTAILDLDLAEDIYSQEVTLNYLDHSAEYRMFQRYRTSMTVSLEGPHLDLVDWRHFDSKWIPLESLGVERFRTLAIDQMNDSSFPPTTKSEILKEVRRRAGNAWGDPSELVKDCRGPNDGPCLIAISSIYLRIQKKVRTSWIDVGTVEIRVPMGC